ncbi:MAG: porin [Bacteroidetes bacterium]|nr:porin [Bacteroidota bacterium]
MTIRTIPSWCIAVLSLTLVLFIVAPLSGQTKFKFGGDVKMDVIGTDYNNGDVSPESPLRDFHFPAAIPIGSSSLSHDLDFHAKESRFSLATHSNIDDHELKSYFEFDFLLSPAGDERVSNSWNPRLRHAYLEFDNLLVGQTWTTFMIVIIPDDIDFSGAAEGVVFGRQPQVRYSAGPWQISLENPETVLSSYLTNERVTTESGRLPDLVGRRNFGGEWGTAAITALIRQLHYKDESKSISSTTFGWGVSVGGMLHVGKRDDIRLVVNGGSGVGRYTALNYINSAVVDSSNNIHAIPSIGGFVSYRHIWSERWRSNINASVFFADNDASLTGPSVNKAAQSYSVNLIYTPIPPIYFGVELMHARREIQDGKDGSFTRLQFGVRYDFSYSAMIGGE